MFASRGREDLCVGGRRDRTPILLQTVRIIFIPSELFLSCLYKGYKCFLTVQLTAILLLKTISNFKPFKYIYIYCFLVGLRKKLIHPHSTVTGGSSIYRNE